MGTKIQTEATKVSKVRVPNDKFVPPAGIAMAYDQSSEGMLRDMSRDMIANLVEGKPMTTSRPGQHKADHIDITASLLKSLQQVIGHRKRSTQKVT